mmetsp:Transcript_38031/g.109092  ORF Transcript_38031/g.109092 Transcript_38031/m.109092 type:complete len:276 (+) Transcript_38031:1722-2549(+)
MLRDQDAEHGPNRLVQHGLPPIVNRGRVLRDLQLLLPSGLGIVLRKVVLQHLARNLPQDVPGLRRREDSLRPGREAHLGGCRCRIGDSCSAATAAATARPCSFQAAEHAVIGHGNVLRPARNLPAEGQEVAHFLRRCLGLACGRRGRLLGLPTAHLALGSAGSVDDVRRGGRSSFVCRIGLGNRCDTGAFAFLALAIGFWRRCRWALAWALAFALALGRALARALAANLLLRGRVRGGLVGSIRALASRAFPCLRKGRRLRLLPWRRRRRGPCCR